MDVFTLDGAYVGTVVHAMSTPSRAFSKPDCVPPNPLSRKQERGSLGAGTFSGESLGPAPTQSIGNHGPSTQARVAGFGASSAPPGGRAAGRMLLVRLVVAQQWRQAWPRVHWLPLALVQAVSHERVILSVTAAELDQS